MRIKEKNTHMGIKVGKQKANIMEITRILSDSEIARDEMEWREAKQYFWLFVAVSAFVAWAGANLWLLNQATDLFFGAGLVH